MSSMVIWLKFTLGIVAMVTVSRGCSEPEGGYVPPTSAEKFHYSKHVIVGTVLSTIRPDPMFQYYDSTYGATVKVRCILKGGVLEPNIAIHGAGFVPGLCDSKDLTVGKEYIIFLDDSIEINIKEGGKSRSFMQTFPAADYAVLPGMYRTVCDVTVTYPKSSQGMQKCEAPDVKGTCQRFSPSSGKTLNVTREVETKTQPPTTPAALEGAGPKAGYSKNTSTGVRYAWTILILGASILTIML